MAGNYLKHQKSRKTLALILMLALLVSSWGLFGISAEPVYAEGTEGYVTVRIEGNGHGTDGTITGKDTILDETQVPMADLPSEPKAIDAINKALELNGLENAVLDEQNWYAPVSFGGVTYQKGYGWHFIYNDAEAGNGLLYQPVKKNDSIVLYLTAEWTSENYRKDPYYSYFTKKDCFFSNEYGPYAEISLILKRIIPADYETTFSDSVEVVTDATVSVTPSAGNEDKYSCSAATDPENGILNFSCWGVGEYIISATKIVDGKNTISRPYCKIILSEGGVEVSAYSTAQDTNLSTLSLEFKFMDPSENEWSQTINGIGYLNGDGITVNNKVEKVAVSATASDGAAAVAASYKAAGDGDFSSYDLGNDEDLDVGDNIFKFTVTNDTDTQIHTLIITRESESIRDIPAEISAVINGVKTVIGSQPITDWILAMNAIGEEISEEDKEEYLAAALSEIYKFAYRGEGNAGGMAKMAIALAALGIDVTNIQDSQGIDAPVNLFDLIANYKGSIDKYSAPYILLLYDLEKANGEKVYPLPANPKVKREALIDTILNTQKESGLFDESIDYTGMAMSALAPYYLSVSDNLNGIDTARIKTAIGKAITALSTRQSIDGGFGSRNSNTTSTVILGLAALGIDAHNDSRFIKGGSTLITDLLSFRTNDNKLGFDNNTLANVYASIQGFQALAAYENLHGSGSSNLYHFDADVSVYTNWPDAKLLTSIAVTKMPDILTYDLNEPFDPTGMEVTAYFNANPNNFEILTDGDYTISPIDTSSAGTKMVTVSYQGQTATFNVTVLGSGGSVPEEKTVKITIKSSGKGTIASDSAYVIEPGKTTVMDVLKAVLSKAKISFQVAYGGKYVAEIDGLGEFTGGENSGWLYYVDGEDPKKSAADCKLYGGEVIEWIYTLDFTKEKGSEQWNQLVLTEEITGTIAKDALDAVLKDINAGKADSWTVSLALGEIAFDREALTGLLDQISGDSVEITIEQASNKDLNAKQREAAGDRPVYNINVTSGKKNISEFGGKITISLPYKLKEGESPLGIVVYYLNDEGTLIPLKGSYDPVSGKVVFTVDHLSYFVIGYDEALAKWPFTDVTESDWFYTPVKYAYERGIFKGIDDTTFAPNSPLTRSMLVAILARMSGADLSAYNEVSFNDVDIDSWYGPSVAWAKETGVVSGYANKDGSFSFKPDDRISRQDIAVMLNNYNEKVAKKSYEQKATKLTFTDHQQIANYAKAAVESMQQAGIINGIKNADGSFRFQPLNNATRAEAATMIYNMLVDKN